MRLDETIQLFLGEKKATTAESYRYCLADFAQFVGPARPLSEIDEIDLMRYMQNVKARDYALATIGKYAKTLKVFLNWCHNNLDDIWGTKKPLARVIKMPRVPRGIDIDRAITEDEIETVIERHRYDARTYALLYFAADTGARAGGMANLKVNDIDFDNNEVSVIEKGDKSRRLAFGNACKNALQRWLVAKHPDSYPYVFRFTQGDKPMTSAAISQQIRRACQRAGIRSLGSHAFRHRKGFQMSDAGVSPSVASVVMGHEDAKTTLDYYYPKDWRRAREALSSLALPDEQKTRKIIQMPDKKSG